MDLSLRFLKFCEVINSQLSLFNVVVVTVTCSHCNYVTKYSTKRPSKPVPFLVNERISARRRDFLANFLILSEFGLVNNIIPPGRNR